MLGYVCMAMNACLCMYGYECMATKVWLGISGSNELESLVQWLNVGPCHSEE